GGEPGVRRSTERPCGGRRHRRSPAGRSVTTGGSGGTTANRRHCWRRGAAHRERAAPPEGPGRGDRPMLTLTGVTKTFGGRRVLDGLDLAIGPGESVAMLGANGSGKTTTLRCIVGLARPDAGRIA